MGEDEEGEENYTDLFYFISIINTNIIIMIIMIIMIIIMMIIMIIFNSGMYNYF